MEAPMSDDKFFERLRADAQPLRFEPADEAIWTRLAANVRARIEQPTVTQVIAAWLRPLAASLAAVALAAALGIAMFETDDLNTLDTDPIEISMAGTSYRVDE
jgi:hypothetical protein